MQKTVNCADCPAHFIDDQQLQEERQKKAEDSGDGGNFSWWWCRDCLKTVCRFHFFLDDEFAV